MHPEISVIVATRNRVQALEMSLPLILSQSIPPKEVFVVDSSDDPEPVKALIARLQAGTDIPIDHIVSAPGLTRQRNVGLARISAPIVAFPDDDSLLYKTYLEEIGTVYEADTEEVLVGVTVMAARKSPLTGQSDQPKITYAPKSTGRVRHALGKAYSNLEHRFAPVPYVYLRQDIRRDKAGTLPDRLSGPEYALVPDQEGFRMSFRTKYLRQAPFNANMSGYSLGEDIDVCYGLADFGSIVRINKPLIYHHEFPGARANGHRWGIMQPINIAYIVSRHTEVGHKARKAVLPWLRFLLGQSLLRIANPYQRERLQGLLTARRHIGRLTEAPRQDVDSVYVDIMSDI